MEKFNLTINQLMLLLDIYRGTFTQSKIWTLFQDFLKLQTVELLEFKGDNFHVTVKGILFINEIKIL